MAAAQFLGWHRASWALPLIYYEGCLPEALPPEPKYKDELIILARSSQPICCPKCAEEVLCAIPEDIL